MISHEEEREMLAAHALGALDDEEARRLREHLAGCAECRAELDGWRETASALALNVEAAEPSAELRSRILESVRAESKPAPAGEDHERKTPSNVVRMPRSRWGRAEIFGAIAAGVAIVSLLTSLFLLWRVNETRRELAKYQTAVDVLARQAAEEREARELLTSPASQTATLAGTNMAPGAHAQLAFDQKTGHAMFFAYNLPQAPAGKAYQLWFISGTKVMPGRVFTPDAKGRAMINEEVPVGSLGATPIFAVTLEPSAGVQTPTGEKYLMSSFS